MSKELDTWLKAKQDLNEAKRWQKLGETKGRTGGFIDISEAHCKPPKLVRAGQTHTGGNNYWNTEEAFEKAILSYLVDNWKEIGPRVIASMEKKEKEALINCQNYVDQMQDQIDAAKNCAAQG